MENFNGPIVVGNVSYEFFSTFDDIRYLSDEVKTSYIIFLRRIGVCSVDCLAKVLCEKDTNKLRNLLRGLHLQEDVDKDGCQENLATTKEWQERILGTDPRKYSISIRGIIQESRHDSLVGPARFSVVERRIEEALKKQQNLKNHPKEAKKVNTMEKLLGKPIKEMTQADILLAAKACPLKPIHDGATAKREDKYFENLLIYFPHINAKDIATYLFEDTSQWTVGSWLKNAGIKRGKGCSHTRDSLYERAAFVAWTGHDYESYVKEEVERNEAIAARMRSKCADKEEEPMPESPENDTGAPKLKEPSPENNPESVEKTATENIAKPTGRKPRPAGERGNVYASIDIYGSADELFAALAEISKKYRLDINRVDLI